MVLYRDQTLCTLTFFLSTEIRVPSAIHVCLIGYTFNHTKGRGNGTETCFMGEGVSPDDLWFGSDIYTTCNYVDSVVNEMLN